VADFVIVGGGNAGFSAARTLREEGAKGSILLLSRDPDPPYDRTTVSKGYLQGQSSREEVLLGGAGWFAEHDVELRTRTSAMKLDTEAHTVTLANKDVVSYTRLLLATGANVRRLRVDGAQLDGIHYLRALGNADALRADPAQRVVCVGGSYIATEVAAALTAQGRRVALVMQEEVTLERSFGKAAGGYFQKVLSDHGVEIHGGEDVERFEGGEDGRVTAVVTARGTRIECGAVVVGVGVAPDVSLAAKAGLAIGERGGVLTDERLRTSAPDVWAAGDIAEYASPLRAGEHVRIEHWDVAETQGRTAALNMLDRETAHEVVPYFFSDLADWSSMEYVGPADRWDEELVRGSFEDGAFTVYYLDGGRLAAALSVGRSEDLERARELIASRAPVDREALSG
jgi:3-phenylpropionate/trans-cinnamate dioxygenase ferredoxin reductase subunit